MEELKMIDARKADDEALRRARSDLDRQSEKQSAIQRDQVLAYRCMVARVNAATDTEMDMALFAR